MKSETLIKEYANSLIGKKFIRHSKYVKGSYIIGEVGSVKVNPSFTGTDEEVLFHSVKGDFKYPSGEMYLTYSIYIISTTGIEYDYNGLHFRDK